MKRILILIYWTLLTAAIAVAASFNVNAPRRVGAGESFNVSFSLQNAEGSNFDPPEVSGAKILFGPTMSMSIANVQSSRSSSTTYTMTYTMTYRAGASGKVSIGSASVTVGGKRLTTKPLTIDIAAGGSAGGNGGQQSQRQPVDIDDIDTQSADRAVSANDLFVRVDLSKQRVYEQQAVVGTVKLYTKYQISNFIQKKEPSFDGFLIEEIEQPLSLNNIETLNGQRYYVAVLKRCILYPQRSGTLTISSGEYEISAVQYVSYRTRYFTTQQPVEKTLNVKSNRASVTILPLPEPRPASFTGAVGKFTINSELKPEQLKTFSAATLTTTITGTGNIKYIKAPEIELPDQFDVYEPSTDVKTQVSGNDVTGTSTTSVTFIPQHIGEYDLPQGEFTFFDPDAAQYVTLPINARHLTVAAGKGTPSQHEPGQGNTIDIAAPQRAHAADLRPMSDIDASHAAGYITAYLLPLAIAMVLLWFYRKQLRLRGDAIGMRRRKASKVAARRLKAARALAGNQSRRTDFYGEVLNALWGFIGDKMALPTSALSRDTIDNMLELRGIEPDVRDSLISLLDECQMAQYSPLSATTTDDDILNRAANVIDALNQSEIK